ncbi:DUF2922 domain-containing protein [Planococcus shenhongbingii]|uniref:DUF2922 domain-containing protein n=1 Tax=Planococcus shenhongbingii TaxID=3058398 RepID=A0ABT8NDD9_9BACL|nr:MULTISPECIES: DUF2922 domain-containing protein [unclassified Planococcus (in: firmicutes)]MDN7245692.1 DUF2922 domain-containing protein [Planococcus sp. N017]WKA60190.1 DUF2922 domain-containing protein [Planococcus sp. N016]
MAKTLELVFETTAGKEVTLSVEEPRENLTPLELQTGMQTIITHNIFEVEGSAFATAKAARIVERNVVDYQV